MQNIVKEEKDNNKPARLMSSVPVGIDSINYFLRDRFTQ